MAEHHANQRDHNTAIRLYKEALEYTPDDPKTLLALAKLYRNELDGICGVSQYTQAEFIY